jgi:bifunctional non-homologous end joining protein LigD
MTLFQERPITPMMAKVGPLTDSDNYLFEVKWDGLRALLFLKNGKVELQNRNRRDTTMGYPEIQGAGGSIKARTAILDGEVVVLNDRGLPDFGRLQTRFGHIDPRNVEAVRDTNPAVYVAFDLLHLDGKDLINEPLEKRKNSLRNVLVENPHLVFGDHVTKDGSRFYSELLKLGFEGVIAKDRGSQYLPGVRSSYWVKVKGAQTIDAFVVGYTAGEGARTSSFGALVMVMYDRDGKMVHVGNVGGGFDHKTLDTIRSQLDRLVTKTPVVKEPIEAPSPIVWVKPRIVCEILYSNITRDKKLRFPRFSKLRTDKRPEDCVLDEGILSR